MNFVDLSDDSKQIEGSSEVLKSGGKSPTVVNIIWQINPHELIEEDWIEFLFSEFKTNHIEDPDCKTLLDNSIVVTRGFSQNETSVKEYLQRFKQKGYHVGVLHLSDEWFTAPVDFYPVADFVFRNFYRPDVARLSNVLFVPVGYKQGLHKHSIQRRIEDRQYIWSFAGQLGGKVSRRSMIKHAKKVPGGIAYIGEEYNDSKDLSFEGYVELICDTKFVLSPAGNRCAETSRFYEALEVGAIPIVEDVSKINVFKQILKEVLSPAKAKRHKVWTIRYWKDVLSMLLEQSYWIQVFGEEFPCPRCSNWSDLHTILSSTDVESTSRNVQQFWQSYKQGLKQSIQASISQHFESNQVQSSESS